MRAVRIWQAGLLCMAIGLILRTAWWLALAIGFLFAFLTCPIITGATMNGVQRRFAGE